MKITCKSKLLAAITFFSSSLLSASSFAHHSLVGEFDTTKSFDIRGKITKVEWTNPHIYLFLDVDGEKGQVVKWQCELGSPNQLVRQGWKKEDLPLGTIIRSSVNHARDGSNTCSTRKLTLDDGTPVFTRGAQ